MVPGRKAAGRGVDYPPPSTAEVKERVGLYLFSPPPAFVASSRVIVTFTCSSLFGVRIVLPFRKYFGQTGAHVTWF